MSGKAIRETVGFLAVIAGLAFVGVEMKNNTNAVQAQTYQDLMQQLNDYRALALMNPEPAELREKWNEQGWQGLLPTERTRLRTPSTIRWGIYEAAYYANERGVLGDREWERFRVGICRSVESQSRFWDPGLVPPMTELLTPDFVGYIESSCD